MTDIEGFLTIYGHSDNLLNNKYVYMCEQERIKGKIWGIDSLTSLSSLDLI